MRELEVALMEAVERRCKRAHWRYDTLERAKQKLLKLAPEPVADGRPDFLILSEDTLREMRADILRHPTDRKIALGKAVNDLLFALAQKELYRGRYLNVPTQIKRRLAIELQDISPEQMESVNFIVAVLDDMDCLYKSKTKKISMGEEKDGLDNLSDKALLEEAFSHFLVSAWLDGAISNQFLKGVFDIRSVDVTFEPFSISISNYLDASTGDGGDNISRYRFWLSQRTAIYFLRLLLLLVTTRRSTDKYHYSELYLFPDEVRSKEKKIKLIKSCEQWLNKTLANADTHEERLSMLKFRELCLYRVFQGLPCFVVSMLRGEVESASYHYQDLALLDTELGQGPELKFKRGKREPSKIMSKKAKLIKQANEHLIKCREQLADWVGFRAMLIEIGKIRRKIKRDATMKQRAAEAESLMSTIRLCETYGRQYNCYKNLQFYCFWLKDCLLNSRMEIKSIQTYGSELETNFLIMLGATAIEDMDIEKIKLVIRLTMSLYDSRNIRTSIRSFTDYIEDEADDILPEIKWLRIDWYDVTLNKKDIKRTKPIVTFEHLLKMMGKINFNPTESRRLRIVILLGFFAGLRISEICHLGNNSLIFDGGWVLMVRHSKSYSGIRDIPLSYLVPQPYLKEIVGFLMAAQSNKDQSRWLFSEDDPYKQSIDYSHAVANLFREIKLEKHRFHHLRHSFVNWFILRWFVDYLGKEKIPATAKFRRPPMFSEKSLSNVSRLLSGHGKAQTGQSLFVYILQALAKIIGHSGPATTMTNYVHICDYLYYLLTRQQLASKSARLRSISVEQLLQLSNPSLPADLRKKKKDAKIVQLALIIRHQVKRLNKKMNAANKRQAPR